MPSQLPGSDAPGSERPLAYYASLAHVARVYDYLLGGKDNFAADREAAEQAIQINPDIVSSARANRAFLVRTASYLTGQAGIRQFLDIGTGMPTNSNIHEVAQSIAPDPASSTSTTSEVLARPYAMVAAAALARASQPLDACNAIS